MWGPDMVRDLKWGFDMEGLGMGGPDMGGLIWYGACNEGPGIVRNVPNPALSVDNSYKFTLA